MDTILNQELNKQEIKVKQFFFFKSSYFVISLPLILLTCAIFYNYIVKPCGGDWGCNLYFALARIFIVPILAVTPFLILFNIVFRKIVQSKWVRFFFVIFLFILLILLVALYLNGSYLPNSWYNFSSFTIFSTLFR